MISCWAKEVTFVGDSINSLAIPILKELQHSQTVHLNKYSADVVPLKPGSEDEVGFLDTRILDFAILLLYSTPMLEI